MANPAWLTTLNQNLKRLPWWAWAGLGVGGVLLLGGTAAAAESPEPEPEPTPPPPPKPGGTPFGLSDDITTREGQILALLEDGQTDHAWVPLVWTAGGHQMSVLVSRRALALYDGTNRLIVNMSYNSAQKAADLLGAAMMTTKIADEIQKQAPVKIAPITQTWSQDGTMSKTDRMVEQSGYIDKAVGSTDELVSNEGKDWVITRRFWVPPQGTGNAGQVHNSANFGWYLPSSKSTSPGGMHVIQSVGLTHNRAHTDYSQLLRFVQPDSLLIDGKLHKWADVLADPALSALIQDEGGTVPSSRHPDL